MVLGVLHDIGLDSPRVDVCMYVCMWEKEWIDRDLFMYVWDWILRY